MPVRVLLPFVRTVMRLAEPVVDRDGRVVAGSGTQLTDRLLSVLRAVGVESVVIADGVPVQPWETVRPLGEEIAELDARFAGAPRDGARGELYAAVRRHLEARAARLAAAERGAGEPADAEREAGAAPGAGARRD
jgi:hypothetical protein